MSSSSSTFIIGIGPSGSSQATVPLTSPGTAIATALTSTPSSTISTMSSLGVSITVTSSPTPTESAASKSAASRTPNLAAILGGTLGGIAVLLWLLALLWWAHRNSWFRRPGYNRQRDTDRAFGKQSPITPTTESVAPFAKPPQPQMGMIGARTFGNSQPPPPTRMSFGDPPRASFGDPPRTNFDRTSFGDRPRPNFGPAPPVPGIPPPRPNPPPPLRSSSGFGLNDRPLSSFGERPMSISMSGFADRDRPRSGFGDRPRSAFGVDSRRSLSPDRVRRFFGANKPDEWEGAGRRISMEPGSPEMEDQGGMMGFFSRVKESAARRKRVKAEYEEDMRRMRGRSIAESDYGR